MDFVNQGYARLVDLFKSMTPGARITAGLLLTMVVISLAYLVNHTSSGQQTYLMGGEPFSAAQLPSMEAAFSKANLNDYVIEGNRVRVPFGKQAAYMGALADGNALPSDYGKIMEKAVATSPWMSKADKAETLRIAKQNELQQIICHMRGVENASVLYDVEPPKTFQTDKVATASVSVKPLGGAQLDDNQVRMIRNVVAGAFAGLKTQSVTVTDLNGKSATTPVQRQFRRRIGRWRRRRVHRSQGKVRKAMAGQNCQCPKLHSRRAGDCECRSRGRDVARRVLNGFRSQIRPLRTARRGADQDNPRTGRRRTAWASDEPTRRVNSTRPRSSGSSAAHREQ